jgi:hypothetical protein
MPPYHHITKRVTAPTLCATGCTKPATPNPQTGAAAHGPASLNPFNHTVHVQIFNISVPTSQRTKLMSARKIDRLIALTLNAVVTVGTTYRIYRKSEFCPKCLGFVLLSHYGGHTAVTCTLKMVTACSSETTIISLKNVYGLRIQTAVTQIWSISLSISNLPLYW